MMFDQVQVEARSPGWTRTGRSTCRMGLICLCLVACGTAATVALPAHDGRGVVVVDVVLEVAPRVGGVLAERAGQRVDLLQVRSSDMVLQVDEARCLEIQIRTLNFW